MSSESWLTVRLGDLVAVKHGWPFKSESFSAELTGRPIVVSIGNFQYTGGFRFADTPIKEYRGDYPREFELSPGDTLLVMTCQTEGGEILGIPARIPDDGRVYLHNQRMGKVFVKRSDLVDLDFLYWVFLWGEFNRELVATSSGTKIVHSAPSRIESFEFDLPPLDEQRAIASILGALDDKIGLNRQMNRTLDALVAALFKSWFVDFDPVVAKTDDREPFAMSAETAALFPSSFEDSELGAIPEGWRVEPVGSVVKAVGGSTPATGESRFWGGGDVAWATPRDLASLQDPVLLSTERRITRPGLERISSGLLPAGTVLLSSRAPIGYVAIAEIPVAVNQGFIALVRNVSMPSRYLYHWLLENMGTIESRANGTTFLEISKANFRPLPMLVPSRPILHAFEGLVRPLHEKLVANVQESRTLAELRDSLLPKLLSGEIRVRQAEKALAEV